MNRSALVLSATVLFLSLWLPAFADPPRLHTDRPSPKLLPLPKGDDVFHFVVFGDRTGGPPEGIKVLAQAVEDANLLDPDLVMTVGDLVNGYNQTGPWMEQMKEFQTTMAGLKMPWFPVAGNHDIYWRASATTPEPKPPREHEEHYEKHFGPLWYWFEHKNTGFLVLFSDEGHPDGRTRSFSDPEQQRLSPAQLAWLKKSLAEMQRLRHVFVFLHHPFWWTERYPGNRWDDVHALLAANGNVRAVLAGHIHQMRYDGKRDGIEYFALATTGGGLSEGMEHRYFGLLHHFNVVTVRSNGFSMASIPVGGVFDPRQFTPERLADVEAARYLLHTFVSPPIPVQQDGSATAVYRVAITNPCSLSIDLTLLAKADASWNVGPDHRHGVLGPRQQRVFDFACVRAPTDSLDGFEAPEFELRFDVLTADARLGMPHRSLRARTTLVVPQHGWPVSATNGFFVFDGKTACLELDRDQLTPADGPFTLEAWVRPDAASDGGLVSSLGSGGFGLEVRGTPRFVLQTQEATMSAVAPDPLPAGSWSHIAGVYDGERILLFVNGRQAAVEPARGSLKPSDKSLYVGARPSTAWNLFNHSYPTAFWKGAVDDVRLSNTARYTRDFTPSPRLSPDASTRFALSNDLRLGPFAPADVPASVHARIQGGAMFIRQAR